MKAHTCDFRLFRNRLEPDWFVGRLPSEAKREYFEIYRKDVLSFSPCTIVRRHEDLELSSIEVVVSLQSQA